MYIKYNNIIYDSVVDNDGLNLITRCQSKINEEFLKTTRSYYKIISPNDSYIQDIFDVKFFIKWDSHMEYVTTKWNIQSEDYRLDGRVHLFHEGHLPEWYIEEKGLCSRDIEADVIEGYSVEYIYKTKDGQKLDEPLVIEKEVDRQEFEKLIEMYRKSNI